MESVTLEEEVFTDTAKLMLPHPLCSTWKLHPVKQAYNKHQL